MVSDNEMRKMLKKMIENDKVHAEKLKEFEKKGDSYDKLWNDSLYSDVSICLPTSININ
jgi:uncharacterized protein Yka (UPF0111/DUF47 family)